MPQKPQLRSLYSCTFSCKHTARSCNRSQPCFPPATHCRRPSQDRSRRNGPICRPVTPGPRGRAGVRGVHPRRAWCVCDKSIPSRSRSRTGHICSSFLEPAHLEGKAVCGIAERPGSLRILYPYQQDVLSALCLVHQS
jgi:hypothetical protein